MQLEVMRKVDLPAVHKIETASNQFPWSLKNFQDSLEAGHQAWVFRDNEQIIAFALVQKVLDEAHLLNICVRPDRQGQGIGRRLLNGLIDKAVSQQSNLMVLEVRSSNRRAQALYLSMGFNEMSIRRGYYPAVQGREDAVLMGMMLFNDDENFFSSGNIPA
ncbi:ribosomal protein S18-alanine N-acetyltransferase [Methylophaga sp. OBS3]|uniref:ribosomal protein S18-alanine N-acetyltransferase n=1 Tax=Methylophaga sp. OBS3 TaxID=2991934 RepID=UPI00224F6F3A|nr:ribosomal protein S18-alanine N-acetyltransferase [Methylophaga sp. OBS3]MCX4189284.1 ribosomal protein S18-alanine N-acetyltransferase [Methylophaga sp. OBS3]